MADEKVNMGPEENKAQETLSPPGQGELPPLEENNTPAVISKGITTSPITINLDRKVGQPVRLSFHLMPKLQ